MCINMSPRFNQLYYQQTSSINIYLYTSESHQYQTHACYYNNCWVGLNRNVLATDLHAHAKLDHHQDLVNSNIKSHLWMLFVMPLIPNKPIHYTPISSNKKLSLRRVCGWGAFLTVDLPPEWLLSCADAVQQLHTPAAGLAFFAQIGMLMQLYQLYSTYLYM